MNRIFVPCAFLMAWVAAVACSPPAAGQSSAAVSRANKPPGESTRGQSQSGQSQSGQSQSGQSQSGQSGSGRSESAETNQTPTTQASETERPQLTRLHPKNEVWIDQQNKRVIVGGEICLRRGQLEMFACPRGTKEHESIVAVNSKAYIVHTALLSIGAHSGRPVQYQPAYRSAEGDRIKVEVIWRDDEGNAVRTRAQRWIRNIKTRQSMAHHWVFAGSGFWKDEESGQQFYQAEGGELICLSNFSTATLDLPVKSPRDNANLLYEAWTERIPEKGTPVRLVLSVDRRNAQTTSD